MIRILYVSDGEHKGDPSKAELHKEDLNLMI